MERDKEGIKCFLIQLEKQLLKMVNEYDIYKKIDDKIKKDFAQNTPLSLVWEKMAFAFVENYQDEKTSWGTYFGPLIAYRKDGQIFGYPNINEITEKIISYWEERSKESNNPIFSARYSCLVLDLKEKVTNKKANYSFKDIFVDSIIKIANRNLLKHACFTIPKLEKALSVALSFNDKERVKKLVDVIIAFEERISSDEKPGLWGFSYELLIKNKKVQIDPNKETKIIGELEKRYIRLIKERNYHPAKEAAVLLVDYYSKRSKVKEILDKLKEILLDNVDQESSFTLVNKIEELIHLYKQEGLNNEANDLLVITEKLDFSHDFKVIETTHEIPINEIEELTNWCTDNNICESIKRIAISFIPNKEEVIKQLKDLSRKKPLPFLMTRKIMDDHRIIATIGSLEEDIDGHIANQISENMKFSSYFLQETMKLFIEKHKPSVKDLLDNLYKSPFFNEERKELFSKGIESYLEEDYLTSICILVPQIEHIIRNIAEALGLPILKISRYSGFNYRTLDDLLRDKSIKDVLDNNVCLYLRILLTDPRGWNLRNNICHGISKPSQLNQFIASRVIHVLLLLSFVREVNNQGDKL